MNATSSGKIRRRKAIIHESMLRCQAAIAPLGQSD